MDVNKTINKKKLFISILIVLSVFICLTSVAAQDSSDANLTQASVDEVSQVSEDMELAVEESASETTSNGNDLAISSASNQKDAPQDKLAATNSKEPLGETVTEHTFKAIQTAINEAQSGDAIYLTSGTYYNDGNGQISISGKDNIAIIGDSTILDAQGKSRIFRISNSKNVTIKNITFKNGHTFGSFEFGGAIYWVNSDDGTVSGCSFVNNIANRYGGAIYRSYSDGGSVFGCSFVNNTVKSIIGDDNSGGAICWFGNDSSVFGCSFVNNTAKKNVIYFNNYNGNNLTVNSNIFLDNACPNEISFRYSDDSSNIDFNWFGNNATDYTVQPKTVNIVPNNWLYLNATANPNVLTSLDPSVITFDLFVYSNATGQTEGKYNASLLMPVNLTVTAANGNVSKNVTQFGETITYTPTSLGSNSITAQIENATQTVEIPIKGDFDLLQDLINEAGANSVINLTRNYTYNNLDTIRKGVVIRNSNVTINGNGYTIDAKDKSRIFWIQNSDNVTIQNITFQNGHPDSYYDIDYGYYGGAIYWYYSAGGRVSNCSFVNNTAYFGGAIRCDYSSGGVVSGCSFVNNTASANGGAINRHRSVGGVVSGCSFVNNTADRGGAIFWFYSDEGVVSGCSFVNNTYKGNYYISSAAIDWYGDEGSISGCIFIKHNERDNVIYFSNGYGYGNLTINYNIFLDNACPNEIYFDESDDSSNIDFNWFGNNATDYASQPITVNAVPNNWLYLNATASPSELSLLDSSDITFDLFVYINATGSTEGKFNASLLMPVNLTVTAANGNVNKNAIQFGEKITYTPDKAGNASVTASIENVHQTIELEVVKGNLTLNAACDSIYYGDNATIVVSGFADATGEARAYVGDGLYCATIENGVAKFTVPGVIENSTATIKYFGDANYNNASTEVLIIVNRIPAEITVSSDSFDLRVLEGTGHFANLTPGDAGTLNYTSSNESVAVVMFGSIFGVGEGTAVITVSFAGNDKYAAAENKTIKVTVTLWDASVSVENDTMKLFVGENGTIVSTTNPDGLTVNYTSSDESVVTVDVQGNVEAIGEGSAVITVSVGNGEFFAYNSTEVSVTVSKIPTEIILTNDTFDLKVNEWVSDVANLTPEGAGNLTFVSSDESIVLASDGMIFAQGKGSATVTVSFAGNDKYAAAINKTINVNVSLRDASVSVENDTLDLKVGDRYDFNATTVPRFLNVEYVSSNESVAKVTDYGIVTAVGEGTCIITLTVGNNVTFAVNSTNVTVKVSKIPTEISASTASELYVGDNSVIAYDLTPEDAVGEVTFTSNDSGVVIVNQDGVVEAVGEGSAVITVDFSGNDKYCPSNATVTVSVSKFSPSLSLDVSNIAYGETEVITITCDVPGTVNVTVNGITETLELNGQSKEILFAAFSSVLKSENKATLSLYNLKVGQYPVEVVYNGNEYYESVTKSDEFTVSSINASISVDSSDIQVGDDETITVILPDDATGNVTVEIDGVNYTEPVEDGKAVVPIHDLPAGDKTAKVYYSGDDNYNPSETTVSFTVSKVKPDISAQDVSSDGKGHIVVSLPEDATGTVTIEIDGKNHTAQVENGKAVFDIPGLAPGKHDIKVYYSGDDKYEAVQFDASITVEDNGTNPENKTIKTVDKVAMATGSTDETTGNPILMLLVALMAIGSTALRKLKK